jgi:succinate-semialdehyde dehydrogenase/glutarate-semialdehyde dehydrogenase
MAYETTNPSTGERVATFPMHTPAEVEKALATAAALFHADWCQGDIKPRLKVLARLSELMICGSAWKRDPVSGVIGVE